MGMLDRELAREALPIVTDSHALSMRSKAA